MQGVRLVFATAPTRPTTVERSRRALGVKPYEAIRRTHYKTWKRPIISDSGRTRL